MPRALKKLIAILTLVSFTSLSVITPAVATINTGNMVGTTLAGVGSMGVYMGLATGAAIGLTGGLAIGALGVAILMGNSQSTSSTPSNSPITVYLNPKKPLIAPSGWTSGTTSSPQALPPSSATVSVLYPSGGQGNFTTPEAAGAANAAAQAQPSTYDHYSISGTTLTMYLKHTNSPFDVYQAYSGSLVISCPTGYTLTGTYPSQTCPLSSATAVIKPVKGVMEVRRTANTFATDTQINPTDVLDSKIVSVTSNKITTNDSDGTQTTITINTDGTTTIQTSKPRNDGTGTSTIRTVTTSAPDATTGDVTVTGVADTIGTGSGAATNTNPTTLPSSGSGSSIDISSLNKEATQQQIKTNTDAIKDNTKDISDAVNNADNNSTDMASEKSDYDTKAQAHSDKIKSIGDGGLDAHGFSWGWSVSIPSGTCTNFDHTFSGHSVHIDICSIIYRIRDIAGFVFYILTGFTLTSIITGRKE